MRLTLIRFLFIVPGQLRVTDITRDLKFRLHI